MWIFPSSPLSFINEIEEIFLSVSAMNMERQELPLAQQSCEPGLIPVSPPQTAYATFP